MLKNHDKKKTLEQYKEEDEGMVLGIVNHDIKIPAQYYERPYGQKLKTENDLLDKLSTLMANRDKNVA